MEDRKKAKHSPTKHCFNFLICFLMNYMLIKDANDAVTLRVEAQKNVAFSNSSFATSKIVTPTP